MAPKFGNYLFRNLQDQPGKGAGGNSEPQGAPALADRVIALRETDFILNEGLVPALAWDRHPGRTVEVHLRDTSGLMEGRVTIQAGVLRKVAGDLVPANIPDDLALPLSLRSVVMQIQPFLESSSGAIPRAPGQDFDTPIAQVAREDEGFFKLAPSNESAPAKDLPGKADAPWPAVPLIREKPEAASGPPRAVVHVARPAATPPESHPIALAQPSSHLNPFGSLPAVGPPARTPDPAPVEPMEVKPAVPPGHGESGRNAWQRAASPVPANPSGKPVRRVALERLQEVFMTEDLLDVGQVLRLIKTLPKVDRAFAVTETGEVLGEGAERLGATNLSQPSVLVKAAGEFARSFGVGPTQGITLLGDQPVSVIGSDRLCLIVFHESRNLPPGMKDRLAMVAAALRDLLAVESGPV